MKRALFFVIVISFLFISSIFGVEIELLNEYYYENCRGGCFVDMNPYIGWVIGYIQTGQDISTKDILLFHPSTAATFIWGEPGRSCEIPLGIKYVWINGDPTIVIGGKRIVNMDTTEPFVFRFSRNGDSFIVTDYFSNIYENCIVRGFDVDQYYNVYFGGTNRGNPTYIRASVDDNRFLDQITFDQVDGSFNAVICSDGILEVPVFVGQNRDDEYIVYLSPNLNYQWNNIFGNRNMPECLDHIAHSGWFYYAVGHNSNAGLITCFNSEEIVWRNAIDLEGGIVRFTSKPEYSRLGILVGGSIGGAPAIFLMTFDGDLIWHHQFDGVGSINTIKHSLEDFFYIAGQNNNFPWFASIEITEDQGVRSSNPATVGYELFPAYPNPFNSSTTVRYSLSSAGLVQLGIYDIAGRPVCDLMNTTQQSGNHQINWNANSIPTGTYFIRLQSQGGVLTRQVNLIK